MSHPAPGVPKLGITAHRHDLSVVTFPLETMQCVTKGISRAMLSLTALAELFRSGSLGNEEASMPHLLAYIVEGLQQCNEDIGQYMSDRTDLAGLVSGGDHV